MTTPRPSSDGSGRLEGGEPALWDSVHARHEKVLEQGLHPLRSAPERAILRTMLERGAPGRGQVFLELGCGSSRLLPYVARDTEAELRGVDFSPLGIEQTRAALEESSFKLKKIQIRAAKFREQSEQKEGLDAELCLVSAMELEAQAKRIQTSILGAVRKLLNLVEQHRHLESLIREELGKGDGEPITEADFEADEERFHIKKVFEQSLCASRSLGRPQIDHGDYIYLWDLGINGKCAQTDLAEFWYAEQTAIDRGASINELRTMELDFLDEMAARYRGCATRSATEKGLLTSVPGALIK